jgi:hypothetical protein
MFKNLSEEERKALEDYIKEKRDDGKTDEEIMKDAGTKAFLFFFLIILVMVFLFVGVAIVAGGDLERVFSIFGELKGMVAKFISWNFPRLASGISPADEL